MLLQAPIENVINQELGQFYSLQLRYRNSCPQGSA